MGTSLPPGAKAIALKWIFKIKQNSDGSINKHISRLVAKGYIQRHGIDYEVVFAPVARIETSLHCRTCCIQRLANTPLEREDCVFER